MEVLEVRKSSQGIAGVRAPYCEVRDQCQPIRVGLNANKAEGTAAIKQVTVNLSMSGLFATWQGNGERGQLCSGFAG